MSRLIDADALIEEIAKIADLRTLSTKTIGEAIDRVPGIEIIHCKDCIKHNRAIGDFEETENGYHWFWKDDACPLVQYRGKAQGHEFDYQFCVCGCPNCGARMVDKEE